MKPIIKLAATDTPDGGQMILYQHDRDFSIKINRHELMNSRQHELEMELPIKNEVEASKIRGEKRSKNDSPTKGRSAKSLTPIPLPQGEGFGGLLVTYFRKGKVQRFFKAGEDLSRKGQRDLQQADELDFISAAEILESEADEKKKKLPETYFDLPGKNKDAFLVATTEDGVEIKTRRGQDSGVKIMKLLKMTFKNTKTTHKALQDLGNEQLNPLKVLAILQTHIPARLLESHYAEENPRAAGKREVTLSMYLSE